MSAKRRCLLLFAKPPHPGRVKTRLIGDLTAEQAAELYAAFLDDLTERLAGGDFDLKVAWALDEGEGVPPGYPPGLRQNGADLGERMLRALQRQAAVYELVGVVGSDHPTVEVQEIDGAFRRLEAAAEVALGPTEDGGYYLLAARAAALSPRLFADVAWSTEEVLSTTLERCSELGLEVELLPPAWDVDTPADLERLATHLTEGVGCCPRTRRLLEAWGRLARVEG